MQAGNTQGHTHTQIPQRRMAGHSPTLDPAHTPTTHKPARMAGYKRGAHTNRHTPIHPSQEWRGAAPRLAGAHNPVPHPQPRGAGDQAGRAHKHTQPPTPHLGVAGRSQNRSPSTDAHTAHPNRERQGTGGARTQPRTPQNPNKEWWGTGRNPSPTANTANPSLERRGRTTTRTQTHPPKTPARADGVTETRAQAEPGPRHKRHITIGTQCP